VPAGSSASLPVTVQLPITLLVTGQLTGTPGPSTITGEVIVCAT